MAGSAGSRPSSPGYQYGRSPQQTPPTKLNFHLADDGGGLRAVVAERRAAIVAVDLPERLRLRIARTPERACGPLAAPRRCRTRGADYRGCGGHEHYLMLSPHLCLLVRDVIRVGA